MTGKMLKPALTRAEVYRAVEAALRPLLPPDASEQAIQIVVDGTTDRAFVALEMLFGVRAAMKNFVGPEETEAQGIALLATIFESLRHAHNFTLKVRCGTKSSQDYSTGFVETGHDDRVTVVVDINGGVDEEISEPPRQPRPPKPPPRPRHICRGCGREIGMSAHRCPGPPRMR